jgi:hypothetical protein
MALWGAAHPLVGFATSLPGLAFGERRASHDAAREKEREKPEDNCRSLCDFAQAKSFADRRRQGRLAA